LAEDVSRRKDVISSIRLCLLQEDVSATAENRQKIQRARFFVSNYREQQSKVRLFVIILKLNKANFQAMKTAS
jgi:hypothetical protein